MEPTLLLDASSLRAHVQRLGAEIAADHPDGVVLVGVLKGALLFLADLARAVSGVEVTVDFISISRFAPDSGRVRILHDLETDVAGRDVVLVEDIVDTGLTLAYLMSQLSSRGVRRLTACALLDRPRRRIVPQELRYRGIVLDDEFVIGYGLHVHELYRNLPVILAADRDIVRDDPAAYVAFVYGRGALRGEEEAVEAGGRVTSGRTEEP